MAEPIRHALLDVLLKATPVFDTLTSMLSIGEIVALSRTCRDLSHLYKDLVAQCLWDIDSWLKRFVDNPEALRQRMGENDGIISGGFAMQFMDRMLWDPMNSDLDICVQSGDKATAIEKHLEEAEDYDLASRMVGKYNWVHNDAVALYDRPVKNARDFRMRTKIEVVHTKCHPIQTILGTYTSALANFITWDAAYSVFPMSTFVQQQTFPTRRPIDLDWMVLPTKYAERGWEFKQRWPKDGETAGELTVGKRRIGDGHTWKIALPTGRMQSPANTFDVETVKFCIEKAEGQIEIDWLLADRSWLQFKTIEA